MRYILRILPGWVIILLVMYVYAYSQINLIADSTILLIVLIAGLVVSFLCAAAEMAIASLDQAELETLNVKNQALLEARRRMNQSDHAQQLDYIKRHRHILQIMEIYYSANALNAPIVIFNNIANILIASLLPVALVTGNRKPPPLSFFGHAIPWAGTESFTFATTIFFLVLFGEVVPKSLGRNYPLAVVQYLAWFISTVKFSFHWLAASFLSVIDIMNIPNCLWKKIVARMTANTQ